MSDTENVAPCNFLAKGIGYFEVGQKYLLLFSTTIALLLLKMAKLRFRAHLLTSESVGSE